MSPPTTPQRAKVPIYLTMILLPDAWERRLDTVVPARRMRELLIRPIQPPRGLLRRLATKFLNPTGSKFIPETLGMYHLNAPGEPVVPGLPPPPELAKRLSWVKFRTPNPSWHQTCPVPPMDPYTIDMAMNQLEPSTGRRQPRMTELIEEGAPASFRPIVAPGAPPASRTPRQAMPAGWELLARLQDRTPFLWADLLLARELSRTFSPMPTAFAIEQNVFNQFVEQGYWEFKNGVQRYSAWVHLGGKVTAYRSELPESQISDETLAEGELDRDALMAKIEEMQRGESDRVEEKVEMAYEDWLEPKREEFARFFHGCGLARFFGDGEAFPLASMPIGPGADLAAEEVPLGAARG